MAYVALPVCCCRAEVEPYVLIGYCRRRCAQGVGSLVLEKAMPAHGVAVRKAGNNSTAVPARERQETTNVKGVDMQRRYASENHAQRRA